MRAPHSRTMAQTFAAACACLSLTLVFTLASRAGENAPAPISASSLAQRWQIYRQERAADPNVIRFYTFAESGATVAENEGGNHSGALLLAGYSPYGVYRGVPRLPAPAPEECPRWSGGRWPGKQALECGTAAQQVFRSGFYGTGNGVFTISAWVYVPQPADAFESGDLNLGGELFTLGPSWGSGWKIGAEWRKWCREGQVSFRFGIPKGVVSVYARPFAFDCWHHIAAAWDGVRLTLSVDGVESSAACKGPYVAPGRVNPVRPEDDTGGFAIGGVSPGSGARRGLRFLADEVAIYRRALNAQETRQQYETFRPQASPKEQQALRTRQQEQQQALAGYRLDFPRATGGYFPAGSPVTIVASPKSTTPLPTEIRPISLQIDIVRSEDSATFVRETIPLNTATPSAPASFRFTPQRCGLHRARLALINAQGQTLHVAEYPFAVVTAELTQTGTLALGVQPGFIPMPGAHLCGLRHARVVLDWARLEPKKNLYDWREADRLISLAAPSALDKAVVSSPSILLCLTGWPNWLPMSKTESRLPDDWTRYHALLATLASRYRNEVAAWEVWNAPNAQPRFFFRGSGGDEAYALLVQQACSAIRKIAPAAVIIGGGTAADAPDFPAWPNRVFALSGNLLAALSYQHAPLTPASPPAGLVAPGWNTACGSNQAAAPIGTFHPDDFATWAGARLIKNNAIPAVKTWPVALFSQAESARWQITQILRAFAAGTQRVFINPGPGEYYPAPNGSDGLPSLKGVALATLAAALGGSTGAQLCTVEGGQSMFALQITRGTLPSVLVLQNSVAQQQVILTIPAGCTVYECRDWQGNPILLEQTQSSAGGNEKRAVLTVNGAPQYIYFSKTDSMPRLSTTSQ